MHCTSQCFRIAERPPTTALRGGKASEDSFTKLRANLVVAYVVEPQLDLFSEVSFKSTSWSGDLGQSLWSLPETDRI